MGVSRTNSLQLGVFRLLQSTLNHNFSQPKLALLGACHRRIAKKFAPISRFQYNVLIKMIRNTIC